MTKQSVMAALLGIGEDQFAAGAAKAKELMESIKNIMPEFPMKQPETMEDKKAFMDQYAKWDAQFPKGSDMKLSMDDSARLSMYENCLTSMFGNTDEIRKLFYISYAGYELSKVLDKQASFYGAFADDSDIQPTLNLGQIRAFVKHFE